MKHIVLAVIAAATICGCDSKKPQQAASESKELLLYCGAGLRPVADELVAVFERQHGVKIVTDYAGSEVLLSKIKLIRKGDLYMPGDKDYVDQAANENMILTRKSVCYFVPVILVQKGNPKNIGGLHDLSRPGLKIGLGDPKACAVGRQTRQILSQNNIAWQDIEKNVLFQSLTVNELGMQIQAQALDAVIVWDAIAWYYADHGTVIRIPAEQNIISTVDIGVLTFTDNRSLAENFVHFAASDQGRAVFARHHYTVEPPK
jgi:molybdate transport system substrate-binding protein